MAHWNKAAHAKPGDPLTTRELEILALLAAGHPTAEVARQLQIRPGTVKTHLTSAYRKIGAKNRVQAARHYLNHHGPSRRTDVRPSDELRPSDLPPKAPRD